MLPRVGTPLSNSLARQRLPPGTSCRPCQFRRNYRISSSFCNDIGNTNNGHAGNHHGPIPLASQLRLKAANLNTPQMRLSSSTPLSSSVPSTSALGRGSISSTSSLVPSASSARGLHDSASPPNMYTTSFAFFEALWEAGVTHVFVNLGSDHPSIIEAMVKGQREKKGNFPRIITCPNEVKPSSLISTLQDTSMLTPLRWSPCPWPTVTRA